jgi:hypothetical protein
MTLRRYLADVRSTVDTHWWIPTIALPIVVFAIPLYLYAEATFGAVFAQQFISWYGLVGACIVVAVALLQSLWSRLIADDADHLVP